MSNLAAQFLIMATQGSQEPQEPQSQTVKPDLAIIMCQGNCLEHTPHTRRNGYYECVICQNRIYGKRLVSTLEDDDQR